MTDRKLGRREALRITAVVGVSVAFGGGFVADLFRRAGLQRVSETRLRMGTVVTITVVHPEAEAARHLVAASFAEIERLDGLLSRHRPDTPLARLNRTGRIDAPPSELLDVLVRAQECSRRTDGAFDVTVAPLLQLYERSFADGGVAPTRGEVEAARRLVDHSALRVGEDAVVLADPRMSVTLDGIAKGYIVDRTVAVLVRGGAERVMVNAGGDVATAGSGSERDPWTIGIQDPHDPTDYVGLVRLGGECIATSGDYIGSFTEDRSHHHIIDPRTGRSPTQASSVSVVAATAMEADALSTAVLVLGPEAGIAKLEEIPGVEGVIVAKDATRVRTSGLDLYA